MDNFDPKSNRLAASEGDVDYPGLPPRLIKVSTSD